MEGETGIQVTEGTLHRRELAYTWQARDCTRELRQEWSLAWHSPPIEGQGMDMACHEDEDTEAPLNGQTE